MPQSLLIAVRFHEGRYHGQADGFDGDHGWPPSPGRLFQALVAGAARGATLRAEDLTNAWAYVRSHGADIERAIRENEDP